MGSTARPGTVPTDDPPPGGHPDDIPGGSSGASGTPFDFEELWDRIAEALGSAFDSQATSNSAAIGLQRELGLGQLALAERQTDIGEEQWGLTFEEQKRQFGLTFGQQRDEFRATYGLERDRFEFEKEDTITQRLMEAAALATGPTGALQLAHVARGQGAPQEDIFALFENLPFVKAALSGQALPGFGVPEQLGGASPRTGGGDAQYVRDLPELTGFTEMQISGMSDFELQFLGALYQAEKGIPVSEALGAIQRSFIPTTRGGALGIG